MPPTLSKIFGLRRFKAKTPIKANNNNQTEKDKGICEARLIDWCIIRIGIIGLGQMAMIKNTIVLTNAINVGSFINNDFNAFIWFSAVWKLMGICTSS